MIKYELDWIDNNWRPGAFINNFKGQVGPGGGRVYVRNFFLTTSTNITFFREKYR